MTRYDKFLIVIVLIVSLAGIFVTKILQDTGEEAVYAVIMVNGEEYRRINLKDAVPGEFIVRTPWGYNTIQIDKNKIRIKEASCPDKVCINQGWISKPNQMAVCLPNRVYVKIVGKEDVIDDVAF